ncbi:MAG: sigma 54-interacting transcriptional regulator [Bacillota bacterium]
MPLQAMLEPARPLLDALYDGVVAADRDGIVVYVNRANQRITGLSAEEVVGRPVRDVVPGSHLLDVLATGRELVGVRTRVRDREVISNIVPIFHDGRLVGAVSVFRDITEVLALSRQLEEARNTIDLLRSATSPGPLAEGEVLIGRNPLAQRAFAAARKAARVDLPVLIEGESGTGKEVMARYIHRLSPRRDGPFIPVNCAAIPPSLLESELFGHEEGAFTGARRGGRAGLFEMADGGTLFLDEIGDLELGLQAKLLRALESGEIRRVGGTRTRKVQVRIISATNRNLYDLVRQKQFREDLYYRLRVIRIVIPPLRERREDLMLFLEHARDRACRRLGRPPVRFSRQALRALLAYPFPGNMRELQNLVEQAVVMDEDGTIDLDDLPPEVFAQENGSGLELRFPLGFPTLAEVERALLEAGLRRFATRSELAAHLGVGRATLYRKLAQYGLDQPGRS